MNNSIKKLVILCGGDSREADISLLSAQNLVNAIADFPMPLITEQVRSLAEAEKVVLAHRDCLIFNLIHGGMGENGKLSALLDKLAVPYIGSDQQASELAMDKWLCKQRWQQHQILTPKGFLYRDKTELTQLVTEQNLGKTLVVKPCSEGSSLGISIVRSLAEFNNAIAKAKQYCPKVLIEQYIDGREMTVSILNDKALPIIEIVTADGWYDYEHKYSSEATTEYFAPKPKLSKTLEQQIMQTALKCHQSLGCRAFSRVDFILSSDNQPYFLEINTVPGLTAKSLLPMSARAVGMDMHQILMTLVQSIDNTTWKR